MPLDANIILQGQAPKFDSPLDAMTKAMTLKSLAIQNQQQDKQLSDQNALNDALKRNITTDPNGNPTVNKQAALSDLYKTNPLKAIDYQKMFQGQDIDALKQHTEAAKNLSWSVLPDGSNYQDVKQKAVQMGLPNADKMPDVYSPTFVQNWQVHTLNGEDQLKKMEIDAKLADTRENRSQRLQDKQDKDQNTAYTDMRNKALSFRGNKSVQNAAEGLRNSDSAMEIINSMKDPNNITTNQYNLLMGEVVKIANGGAVTEAAMHDAKVNTLSGKAAEFWQSVSGKPTPAQLGEFVMQNKDYLEHLNDVNHKYVDEFQMNNAKAYKGRVSKDQYNEYMQDFGPQARASQSASNQNKTAAPVAAQSHPAASEAVTWAKQNPDDPRAQEIMKRLGQ